MSKIVFDDEYVIVVPTFEEVQTHKHSFYHMFFLDEGKGIDKVKIVGGNAIHTMPSLEICRIFIMIDPTTNLAECLRDHVLKDEEIKTVDLIKCLDFSDDMDEEEIRESVSKCIDLNGYKRNLETDKFDDYRIVKLVKEIRDYAHLEEKVHNIADEYNLSESRLSHSFKECMGVSLKGYLSLKQVEYAYKLILSGKTITFAAMEAGFATPSHLAAKCKNEMGISISDVMK